MLKRTLMLSLTGALAFAATANASTDSVTPLPNHGAWEAPHCGLNFDRLTSCDVYRAAYAYALTTGSQPTVDCRQTSCAVNEGASGIWDGWGLTYQVHVRLSRHRIIAWSPLFVGDTVLAKRS